MRKKGEIVKSLWDRFHEKVSPEALTGCWLWTGAVKELGYGVIGLGTREQGTAKAHRVAYQLYKGEIPLGLAVLHHCDNSACVSPTHLYAGTLKQNAQDCVARGRNFIPDNSGEKATWAKLTFENVQEIKTRKKSGVEYAKLFGVSKSSIYEIWRGKNWANA